MSRTDRLTFLRLAGITSAAAFVGGKYLGEPATAWAMHPKFDLVLKLTGGGTVVATGPTGFDADEPRARVYAHVAQAGRVQSGTTGWFRCDAASWACVLTGPRCAGARRTRTASPTSRTRTAPTTGTAGRSR